MAPLNVNNSAERFRAQPMAGGWSWRLIIFTSFLLFIVSASYLGIEFGYLNFLDSRRLDLENQVAQIASSIPDADRENLAEFYSRLENLKATLDKHTGISKIFPFLEKTTHPQVVYDAFEMQMKTQELTLTGRAASFEVLSKQLLAYQQASEVARVLLQSSDLRENIVGFTVKLTLNPSLFKLQ